jgi:hypothetical protein
MRAYYFGNMYLSSIQQGIQAAHATAELFTHYPRYEDQKVEKRDMLFDWAQNHKVMILLNAGYGEELHSLRQDFCASENPYPWAAFSESPEALDGAMTCVAIILPERIYGTAAVVRQKKIDPLYLATPTPLPGCEDLPRDLTSWEIAFISRLNNYGLAR